MCHEVHSAFEMSFLCESCQRNVWGEVTRCGWCQLFCTFEHFCTHACVTHKYIFVNTSRTFYENPMLTLTSSMSASEKPCVCGKNKPDKDGERQRERHRDIECDTCDTEKM